MKVKLERNRTHQKYYVDGIQVPGYSTISNELAKPFLKKWANQQGLKGIDIDKDTEAVDVGSIAHFMIECKISNNEPDLTDYAQVDIDRAGVAFKGFLELEKKYQIDFKASELQLVSRKYRYGGTIDILAGLNGILTLIDIKTNNKLYNDILIQIAAYNQLLVENGYDVKEQRIWRIDKDDGSHQDKKCELTKHFDLFLKLYEIYKLRKELKI